MLKPLTDFIDMKLRVNSRVPRHTRELILSVVKLAYEIGRDGESVTLDSLKGKFDEDEAIAEFLKQKVNNETE